MILPDDEAISPATIFTSVDFPEPLGPEIPKMPFSDQLKLISLKINLLPKSFERF
jgi:hypothetical protein